VRVADGFQQMHRAHRIRGNRVYRLVEADAHMRLGAQVVNLIGLNPAEDFAKAHAVHQIAVVQHQPCLGIMRVFVQMFDSIGVERAAPADDAVNLIPLFEQQFRKVRTILAGDAGDQCFFACLLFHGGFLVRTCCDPIWLIDPVMPQLNRWPIRPQLTWFPIGPQAG